MSSSRQFATELSGNSRSPSCGQHHKIKELAELEPDEGEELILEAVRAACRRAQAARAKEARLKRWSGLAGALLVAACSPGLSERQHDEVTDVASDVAGSVVAESEEVGDLRDRVDDLEARVEELETSR